VPGIVLGPPAALPHDADDFAVALLVRRPPVATQLGNGSDQAFEAAEAARRLGCPHELALVLVEVKLSK
jgi:hypothetical protein